MGDNIKISLEETGCKGVVWINLVCDQRWALVNTVMNLQVPQKAGSYQLSEYQFLTDCAKFCRRHIVQ
jgi:hypothetical protein